MYRIVSCVFFAALIIVGEGPASDQSRAAGGTFTGDGVRSVRLLARYGESYSAWLRLRASGDVGGVVSARLDARLLTEMGRYAEADSVLARTALRGEDAFRHHLQRARLNHLAGRLDRACEHLSATDSLEGGSFTAYRDYLAVKIHLEREDVAAARTVGARALQAGVPVPLQDEFEELMVHVYTASGEPSLALEGIRALNSRGRSSQMRARLFHAEYELYSAQGQANEARRVAMEMLTRYPRYEATSAVVDEMLSTVPVGAIQTSDLLSTAAYMTASGQYSGARSIYRELERRRLKRAQNEGLRIGMAQYYYRRGVYRRAADLAKPAYSEPGYKRQSMLILARSYRRIGRATDAAAIYESFARIYPNHRKSAEALFVAGRIYDRADRRSAAERVRLRLRRAYPSSYFGRMAILESAERLVDVGEYSRAADVLGRRVKRSRRTDEAAMFYLADVYRKTGNVEGSDLLLNELRALDPYSFYIHPWISPTYVRPIINSRGSVTLDGAGGLIEFLERAFAERDAAYVRIAGLLQRGHGGSSTATGASCLERGAWFLDVGFRDWGERELSEARRVCYDSPGELLELARIYEEYAMPWRSVRLVQKVRAAIHWRLRREHADDFRWLLYPTPYPTQVLGNAARHDLPPQLVYAMIREESRFDVEAVSRVGALGLMQLMPETGRYVARELELSGWVKEDLLDPEINITFGIWYAASLAEQGNGDYLWMLAAYNAGPGNARRWFDGFDGDTIRVVDAIDFRETRNYVQRIVESANIYHSLYFGDGSSPR